MLTFSLNKTSQFHLPIKTFFSSMLSQENLEQNKKGHSEAGNGYYLTNFYRRVGKHFFLLRCDAKTPSKTY
jgi:hypothetical protein